MTMVAVAVPSYSAWHPAMGICTLSMCTRAAHTGFSLAILSHSGGQVASVRNSLVRSAQRVNADWLLFIDDDMTFPRETIERLVGHDKDIVGVICSARVAPYPAIGELMEPRSEHLCRASQLGAGILLVRMSVFNRVPAPWFKHQWGVEPASSQNQDGELSEDLYFIREARKHGIEVWCDRDLSVEIGHIGDQIFSVKKDQQIGGVGTPLILSAKQGWGKPK